MQANQELFLLISQVEHNLPEVVESISEEALLTAPVFFDLYRIALVAPLSDQLTPRKGQGRQPQELLKAGFVGQMRCFQVESM